MVEIPRPVVKIGGSLAIRLDKDTRQLLQIENEGDIVILKRGDDKIAAQPTEGTEEDIQGTE